MTSHFLSGFWEARNKYTPVNIISLKKQSLGMDKSFLITSCFFVLLIKIYSNKGTNWPANTVLHCRLHMYNMFDVMIKISVMCVNGFQVCGWVSLGLKKCVFSFISREMMQGPSGFICASTVTIVLIENTSLMDRWVGFEKTETQSVLPIFRQSPCPKTLH